MPRLLLTFILVLVAPMLSAQSSTTTELKATDETDTIPFMVYQHVPNGLVWINPDLIQTGLVDDVFENIVDIPKDAFTAAIRAVKSIGCDTLKNGGITVSLTLSKEGELWVVGVGVGSGFSITFKCKDGVAV